jgi:hypothetical protein
MAKHSVTFTVKEGSILGRDVVFKVFQDGQRFGDLYVSKGGVDWRPKNKQYAHHTFSWETFARLIEGN